VTDRRDGEADEVVVAVEKAAAAAAEAHEGPPDTSADRPGVPIGRRAAVTLFAYTRARAERSLTRKPSPRAHRLPATRSTAASEVVGFFGRAFGLPSRSGRTVVPLASERGSPPQS